MENGAQRNGLEKTGDNLKNGASESPSNENSTSKVAAKVKKARSFMELSVSSLHSVKAVGRNDRRVLVIYTGGTIGMLKNKDGVLIPQKGAFENLIRGYPQLHDNVYWRQRLSEPGFDTSFLVLPEAKEIDLRICYKILEYENLLDSSNMTEVEWIRIAEDIMKYYGEYDGFVVLHGTDTLSYTASALSFMFENIGKGVVLTGSQIPIFEPRSDGADNFVSSLLIAGGLNIPEVTVFFGSKLFRGNRTRKISVNNLYAFDSPNCVPLVEVGIDFEVNKKAIFKPSTIEKCRLHARMAKNVGLLRIFPSISSAVIRAFCQPPIEGVVLESYGSGNVPTSRSDVLDEIAAAVRRGVLVLNITQCTRGAVADPLYESGRLLWACGVVSGGDMTPEAALTKLSYVLSKTDLSYQQKVEMMMTNIRGELTNTSSMSIEDKTLIDALAASLNIQSPKVLIEVTDKVFSALLLHAIERDDLRAITKMLDMGADVNAQGADGRSVLHAALARGHQPVVQFLLQSGANVHLRTRCGESPLVAALAAGSRAGAELLVRCGARLAGADAKPLADLLVLAARAPTTSKLQLLADVGADLDTKDDMGRTALHVAVISNRPDNVRFLLDKGADSNARDALGLTPRHCAEKLALTHIADMLTDTDTHNDNDTHDDTHTDTKS